MGIYQARAGFAVPAWPGDPSPKFSELELLEKALVAIKGRRGLIHGKMVDGKRVCAVGAVAHKYGDFRCDRGVSEPLQEFNDSMPKVSTATRRKRVLAWIEKRLKELRAKQS